jgi:hypothetical protein
MVRREASAKRLPPAVGSDAGRDVTRQPPKKVVKIAKSWENLMNLWDVADTQDCPYRRSGF